jgi:hypothetical protein
MESRKGGAAMPAGAFAAAGPDAAGEFVATTLASAGLLDAQSATD